MADNLDPAGLEASLSALQAAVAQAAPQQGSAANPLLGQGLAGRNPLDMLQGLQGIPGLLNFRPQGFPALSAPVAAPTRKGPGGRGGGGGNQKKQCNCKNSRCLKLYCECFASGRYCEGCNCSNCFNNRENENTRQSAVEAILERNPNAFRPKIQAGQGEDALGGARGHHHHHHLAGPADHVGKHSKGCNCKKSACLKKYCECFQAGVFCSDSCKCMECKNYEGSEQRAQVIACLNMQPGATPFDATSPLASPHKRMRTSGPSQSGAYPAARAGSLQPGLAALQALQAPRPALHQAVGDIVKGGVVEELCRLLFLVTEEESARQTAANTAAAAAAAANQIASAATAAAAAGAAAAPAALEAAGAGAAAPSAEGGAVVVKAEGGGGVDQQAAAAAQAVIQQQTLLKQAQEKVVLDEFLNMFKKLTESANKKAQQAVQQQHQQQQAAQQQQQQQQAAQAALAAVAAASVAGTQNQAAAALNFPGIMAAAAAMMGRPLASPAPQPRSNPFDLGALGQFGNLGNLSPASATQLLQAALGLPGGNPAATALPGLDAATLAALTGAPAPAPLTVDTTAAASAVPPTGITPATTPVPTSTGSGGAAGSFTSLLTEPALAQQAAEALQPAAAAPAAATPATEPAAASGTDTAAAPAPSVPVSDSATPMDGVTQPAAATVPEGDAAAAVKSESLLDNKPAALDLPASWQGAPGVSWPAQG